MASYLYLDFGANRDSVKNKTIFSNSLEDQFSNMLEFSEWDYEDFVRTYFILENATVYFSYPNFNGEPRVDEKYNLKYYNNIAIRFPQRGESNDLVLMGDIIEKPKHRQFIVKALLTVSSGIVHYGELETVCSTVVKVSRDSNWEMNGWEGQKPDWAHVDNSTLSNDFMLELNNKTVVPDAEQVIDELEDWDRYLNSREYLINTDEKKGYDLGDCVPEIFIAYSTSGKVNTDDYGRIKYLKDKDGSAWTLQKVNESSRESILMHIYVDVPEKEYLPNVNSKTNQRKQFDAFTRSPLILLDPNIRQDRFNQQGLTIREKRVNSSMLETVEPLEKLNQLDKEQELITNKFKSDQERKYNDEVKSKLGEFENSVLPLKTDEYLSGQKEAVQNRIRLECESNIQKETVRINGVRQSREKEYSDISQKLDPKIIEYESINKKITQKKERLSQISKDSKGKAPSDEQKQLQKEINELVKPIRILESEVENLRSKLDKITQSITTLDEESKTLLQRYDPEPLINKEMDRLKKNFIDQTTKDEEDRIRTELRPKYDLSISKGVLDIKIDIETKKEETRKEFNLCRFHVYFELEVPENESVKENLKTFEKYQRPGLSLRKDYFGDKILLKRQKDALVNLWNGYVLNPFLATFLFSPKSKGRSTVNHIEHFFSSTLNDSQKEAVEKALSSNGLFLIQGPPGTGKTQVIAEITAQLTASGRKVLIASQNNKAVDNAFSRIPKLPMIRPMRILSENASKQNNPYAKSELLANFYNNLSESMNHEVEIFKNRQRYESELNDYINELASLLGKISDLQKATEDINEKIRGTEAELQAEYAEKDRIENSNYAIEDEQDKKDNEIASITDFTDERFLNKLLRELEEIGFNAKKFGEPITVLKTMYQTPYDEIVSEFVKRVEHEEYFELKQKKSETDSPSEINKLNKELKYYCEDNDFNEKDEFPLFSTLVTVPLDKTAFLEGKQHLDSAIGKKISTLKNAIESYSESKQDLSGVNNEITRLKSRIENLKKDVTYQNLVDAETKFDGKAKEIFVKLRINTIWKNRADAVEELKREKRRIAEEFRENRQEIEERTKAYERMERYISSEEVIKKDSEVYNPVLLKTVNVIGMTCSAKAQFKDDDDNQIRLNELNIDVVIVDEVSKVPFIEILQPILYGKTVILVGDHKQLPPMFDRRLNEGEENRYNPKYINPETEEKYRKMYEESYFAKLFDSSPDSMKSPLNIQYRMHPDIMDVDNVFYNGELKFGGNVSDKEHYLEIYGGSGKRIIGPNNHVIFIDVKGHEVKESGSTSYTNPEEIRTVRKLLDLINKNCRRDRNGNKLSSEYRRNSDTRLSVGVICPYADQAREIRKNKGEYRSFNSHADEKFMVKSVDDFQGDERDIIILSMVRTKKSEFLRDFRRINVAISRARRLLIIVGNRKTLESMNVKLDGAMTPVYRNMIRAIERKNGVLEQSAIMGDE